MILIIKRTKECLNLLWSDIWTILQDCYWQVLFLTWFLSMVTCFACVVGQTSSEKVVFKPIIHCILTFSSGVFLLTIGIAITIGLSHPCRWVKKNWTKACRIYPKPVVWDREDN